MGDSDVSRTRLYLGNLPRDVSKQELEDLFTDYGKITDTKIMNGFGFVEFEDPMDAKDVVPAFHGTTFKGERLTVQFARGPRVDTREHIQRRPNPRRSSFRMQITGLAEGTSWQDLKDFARTAGVDVVYTEIGRYDGTGFVEFETLKDLDIAIEKLDGQEYRGSTVSCAQDESESTEIYSPKNQAGLPRGRSPPSHHRCYYPSQAAATAHERHHHASSSRTHVPRSRYRERSPDYYERDYGRRTPTPRGYAKGPHGGGGMYDDGYRSTRGGAPPPPHPASRYHDHTYRGRPYGRARSPHEGYERERRGYW